MNMESMEDFIGAEITDAFGSEWIEITMPDGRVFEVRGTTRTVRPNQFSSDTFEMGTFEVQDMSIAPA